MNEVLSILNMEIIQSVKFKYESTPETEKLLEDFNQMINYCIQEGLKRKITSFFKLRKAVYEDFKEKFDYNTQYCYSACQVACSILRSWRKRGKEPVAKKRFVSFSPNLTKFDGEGLRISVRTKQFLEIPLIYGDYQKKFIEKWLDGGMKIGQIILNENLVIMPFKSEIDPTDPSGYIGFDVNEKRLVGVNTEGRQVDYDLTEVKRIHDTYFEKRRRIQKKLSNKPNVEKRVLLKYRGRESRRINDQLHKISREVVNYTKGFGIIFENLNGIRKSIKFGKKMNRRLHSWNFKELQSFIEYKSLLNGYPVHYIDPRNTSKHCSICEGTIASNEQSCKNCGIDRHVNACLNILRKAQDVGILGYPEGLLMNSQEGTEQVGGINFA